MGQRLFAAAPQPKFFFPIEGAGHNDVIEIGGDVLLERFKSFLERPAAQDVIDANTRNDLPRP